LADTRQQGAQPRPYDASAGGPILGEGAAALVLERGASVRSRGARCYGRIAGYARSADALPGYALESQGKWLEGAARQAVQAAGLDFGAIDALYGHGCGDPGYDRREMAVMQRLAQGRDIPVGCVLGSTGLAEAASGLFTASAALLGMQSGEVYPVAAPGALPGCLPFVRDAAHQAELRHTLVLGSTEHGNNTAVLLAGGAAA
jgi:3-oxoacyl-(acyl-carrier-protein) synthase